ncbi:helix-turn-helix domain-containing protein [Alicyclobacillus fodiniaquatilis]|uniref:Helix-turn-helix domain-containing protein n=1 Tax=Alicyclobacillus fodiniaquatilis TaxID=1661150 RepID=A0ABW4JJL2_9BACL
MGGIQFGREVKRVRIQAGISSRQLSSKVGKASAYVSQLERGFIRNPDYDTCCKILEQLGINEDQIDIVLEHFGIVSPQILEQQIQWSERHSEEEEMKHRTNYYERKMERLKRDVHSISNALLDLIYPPDLYKADLVITNMRSLTEDEDNFEFLCDLFSHNLSRIDRVKRRKVLQCIKECMADPNFQEEDGE